MDSISKALSADEMAQIQQDKALASRQPARQIPPVGLVMDRTVPLAVPITFDGVLYECVHVRRLKGGDFLRLQQSTENEDISLLTLATGLPEEVISELDADDFFTVSEVARDFLPRHLRGEVASTSADGPSSPR